MANVKNVRVRLVPVQLDKERHLKFDLNAFAELEERYGSVDAALDALEKGSIKAIRTIVWAGLLHEEETLTARQVGSWIGLEHLETLSKALNKAMTDALPEKTEAEQKKAKAQAPVPQKESATQ